MTSEIEKAVGSGAWVEVFGEKYQMLPLVPEDFAEVRAYLRSILPDPMEEAKKMIVNLNDTLASVILREAYKDRKDWGSLNSPDARRWAITREGYAFFFWLSARKAKPLMTLDEAVEIFRRLEDDVLNEIISRIDQANESDDNEGEEETVKKSSRPDLVQKSRAKKWKNRKKHR